MLWPCRPVTIWRSIDPPTLSQPGSDLVTQWHNNSVRSTVWWSPYANASTPSIIVNWTRDVHLDLGGGGDGLTGGRPINPAIYRLQLHRPLGVFTSSKLVAAFKLIPKFHILTSNLASISKDDVCEYICSSAIMLHPLERKQPARQLALISDR